jgi:uncharacterized lipoprotein NlpE involved in copper resistance
MKKMIFSAVALIAFSFAGVANEIEEKKVEVEAVKIEKVETSIDINCYGIAVSTYNSAIWYGADQKQATKLMVKVLVECFML